MFRYGRRRFQEAGNRSQTTYADRTIENHLRSLGKLLGGTPPPEVWAGVNKQIGVLLELAEGEDEGQIEREARSH